MKYGILYLMGHCIVNYFRSTSWSRWTRIDISITCHIVNHALVFFKHCLSSNRCQWELLFVEGAWSQCYLSAHMCGRGEACSGKEEMHIILKGISVYYFKKYLPQIFFIRKECPLLPPHPQYSWHIMIMVFTYRVAASQI